MRSIVFEGGTWEVYEKLRQKRQSHAQKPHKNTQTTPQRDDPTQGYGHSECLKHALTGLWSRKLTKKDRLIYNFTDTSIHIFAIGGHYGDK